MTPGLRKGNVTSYSYANAKKMRKRTKIEQLKTEINIQKQMVNRLASALFLAKNHLDKFGSESVWLEQTEEQEGPHGTLKVHSNYVWNGEENPTKQVKATIEKMMEKLGPLSGMFGDVAGLKEEPTDESVPAPESTDQQPPQS